MHKDDRAYQSPMLDSANNLSIAIARLHPVARSRACGRLRVRACERRSRLSTAFDAL